MTYPAAPEPADSETVITLALDHPMPRGLRDQIASWIEPHTVNTYTDHSDAMMCVGIAYPLIRAYLAEHPDA